MYMREIVTMKFCMMLFMCIVNCNDLCPNLYSFVKLQKTKCHLKVTHTYCSLLLNLQNLTVQKGIDAEMQEEIERFDCLQ